MIVPQVAKMLARPHHKGPQTGDLGSMSGAKWDMKHGLGKRGTDFGVSDGATHGGASLAHKQIKERIFELFGKTDHSDDKRRMGIPTHFDQLQGLLKNLKGAVVAIWPEQPRPRSRRISSRHCIWRISTFLPLVLYCPIFPRSGSSFVIMETSRLTVRYSANPTSRRTIPNGNCPAPSWETFARLSVSTKPGRIIRTLLRQASPAPMLTTPSSETSSAVASNGIRDLNPASS